MFFSGFDFWTPVFDPKHRPGGPKGPQGVINGATVVQKGTPTSPKIGKKKHSKGGPEATLTRKRKKSTRTTCPILLDCTHSRAVFDFCASQENSRSWNKCSKVSPKSLTSHPKINRSWSRKFFEKNLANGTLQKPQQSAQSRLFCLRVRFSFRKWSLKRMGYAGYA